MFAELDDAEGEIPAVSPARGHAALKALVLTNHMADIAGSELVALEVCEALMTRGYEVTLHTNYLAEPMRSLIDARIDAHADENFPNVFDFDFVWSQHLLLPLAISQHEIPDGWSTTFVSAHLSGQEPFELAGLSIARLLGATIVSNSPDGADLLRARGVTSEIIVHHNACPRNFWLKRTKAVGPLRRALVVSNHAPAEVTEAIRLLRRGGIEVEHIGLGGDQARRILPSDLRGVEAVLTIGKTVQYAVMGGVPVYCYDHFGGPGWLDQDNFENAEAFNFSGRCSRTQKSGERIAAEIVEGHARAAEFVLMKRAERKEMYILEHFLDTLQAPSSSDRGKRSDALEEEVKAEAVFAALIRRSYIRERLADEKEKQISRIAVSRAEEAERRAEDAGRTTLVIQQALAAANARESDGRAHLQAVLTSASWRVTRPVRFLWAKVRAARLAWQGAKT